jgi:pimeloyl-ACP methyl ester carboxylesterase
MRWLLPQQTPLWFEEGSAFYNGLHAALSRFGISPQMDAFSWSGANSILHRSSGADRLAEQLGRQIHSLPPSDHVIVAHSHGGNIATLVAHRLRQKGVDVDRLRLVTMGTPFLEVRKTKPQSFSQIPGLSDKAVVFGFPLLLSPAYLIGNFPAQHTFRDFTFYLATSALFYTAMLLFFRFLSIMHKRSTQKPSQRVERLIAQTEGGASWVGRTPLILRAIDDEAALSLAAGALTNRLSGLVIKVAQVVMLLLGCILLSIVTLGWHAEWAVSTIFSLNVIIWAAAAGLQLSRGVFGRELLFGSMLSCEVNCQQSPDVSGEIDVITLKDQLSFRHSMHEIKDVPQIIADWIALKSKRAITTERPASVQG